MKGGREGGREAKRGREGRREEGKGSGVIRTLKHEGSCLRSGL